MATIKETFLNGGWLKPNTKTPATKIPPKEARNTTPAMR